MKKNISTFISNCRDLFQRGQNRTDDSPRASFAKSYKECFEYVEKSRESIALDFAKEREYHDAENRASAIDETLEKQGIASRKSFPHEMERIRRTEQLIEMGKSYRSPAGERSRERDEPDWKP